MSVAAVMMVRDEADMIGWTLLHLSQNVDHVYVLDNGSTDDTPAILRSFADSGFATVIDDPEVGYWQARKMTELARRAHADGYEWVVPCDSDEIWLSDDGATVRDRLTRTGRDVQIVTARMWNHVPTDTDNQAEANPVRRIGWRLEEPNALPKVAARAAADLTIHAGNHGAAYDDGLAVETNGLTVHHYSWRSREQYLRKIRNGHEAYAATDLPPETGAHWRMFDGASDDAIMQHFDRWFWFANPDDRPGIVYDPAPVRW